MKIAIACPPLENEKGVPLLSQNRQFQWFNSPTYIYPMVPAYAATMLQEAVFKEIVQKYTKEPEKSINKAL